MSVAAQPLLDFADATFARDLEELSVPWQAAGAPAPRLLALNTALAAELGIDPAALRRPDGVAVLAGNAVPAGATPVAQAYAGHQFGALSPRLGDGRALLLGEVLDIHGRRRDLHLKGSGRTPFARAGDGKAVVGPMLREYVIGEAMHALGVPTTRALAVVATGEEISRGPMLPGAILTRVAASHLRVGTFEYAALQGDQALLRRLADYAIARHHPDAAEAEHPYLDLLTRVVDGQAELVARWMAVGFIHGVMNTDNMTISGETIDYGPCAFIDAFEPATWFSSIDQAGRYAYGNQPRVAHWNLGRFAAALLPLIDADPDAAREAATAVVDSFPARFGRAWSDRILAKLGLTGVDAADRTGAATLADELLGHLRAQRVDFTGLLRALSAAARGDTDLARAWFPDPAPFDGWLERWRALGPDADAMDAVNPVYIPRNHLVEEALDAATAGDLEPVRRLVDVLGDPFTERPGLARYAAPAPAAFGERYRTFCGT